MSLIMAWESGASTVHFSVASEGEWDTTTRAEERDMHRAHALDVLSSQRLLCWEVRISSITYVGGNAGG